MSSDPLVNDLSILLKIVKCNITDGLKRPQLGHACKSWQMVYGWHLSLSSPVFLTSICRCIANIFVAYNQKDAKFHNLPVSLRHSTCFRRVFRPSSGAQNCTYSGRDLSDQYQILCAVLSCWWWMEKPSETCTASYRNKLTVKGCILLVIRCGYGHQYCCLRLTILTAAIHQTFVRYMYIVKCW